MGKIIWATRLDQDCKNYVRIKNNLGGHWTEIFFHWLQENTARARATEEMDLVGQRSALTRQLEEGREELAIKKGLLESVRGDRNS